MTETYGIFDAADPENPDRVYSAAILMSVVSRFLRDGIVHGDGSGLAVSPTVPAAMTVSVGTGSAIVQGRYYINDDDLVLPIGAANPTYPRIDRVVLRLNITPDREIHATVIPGVPSDTPEPPALIRTSEIWDISLAQVAVGAGATSIIAGNITDERGNLSLCGVAAPTYVPSSQLEVVGAVDMQSNALTGLPVPTTATSAARRDMGGVTLQNLGAPVNANDAARKAYVDSAIGGVGLSQVVIDVDKDWNGKNITNVGDMDANSLQLPDVMTVASGNLLLSVPGTFSTSSTAWVNVTEITLPSNLKTYLNSVRVYLLFSGCSYSGNSINIKVNNVYVFSTSRTATGWSVVSYVITGLKASDKIQIDMTSSVNGSISVQSVGLYADVVGLVGSETSVTPTYTT